jgi:RHS repeat-associated protein
MPDRSSVTSGGSTTSATYDPSGQVLSTAAAGSGFLYSSDGEGRVTSLPGKTLKWDNLGHLAEVDNSSDSSVLAAYAYDPLDRLVTEVVGGVTSTYTYVGLTSTVASVVTSTGSTVSTTAHITDPSGTDLAEASLTQSSGSLVYGTPSYLGRNGHGDVVWQANAAGAISGTAAYDPFGTSLHTAGAMTTSEAWQSSTYDSATGLYNVIARWYSTSLGRFLSIDPVEGSISAPGTLDRYSYGAGDSIDRSDPSGRCWGICIDFNPVAAVQSAMSTVSNAASSVAKTVVSTVSSAYNGAVSWASSTYSSASGFADYMYNYASSAVQATVNTVANVVHAVATTATTAARTVASVARTVVTTASSVVHTVATTAISAATNAAHAMANSPLYPLYDAQQALHAINSVVTAVAPTFQSTIIDNLPGPLQAAWSAVSSPAAFQLGAAEGAMDGTMAVINQMVDAVPSLVSMGGTITSCAMFLGCSDLARSVSGAENSLATMNPATALDSAKHFALDPFADIAHHASAGDWNGAGVAYGHAEVGVAQVALAVSGVCETVLGDSCFLPSLADVVDLGEAASATSGADAGAGAADAGADGARAAADPAATRAGLRVSTKQAIQAAAPKTAEGDFIDPNTGQIIPQDGPFDYGHIPGYEWWRTRDLARSEGWTRQQVLDYENDASHYQIEDPGSNRSHVYEMP